MSDTFRRVLREHEPFSWKLATAGWANVFGANAQFISFPEFISTLKSALLSDLDIFVESIKRAHRMDPSIPEDFPNRTPMEKSTIFFSFFQNIFKFEEIDRFVHGANIGPKNFQQIFSQSQTVLFRSVSEIYKELLACMAPKLVPKYSSILIMTFSKLFIPKSGRFFKNSTFELETIFISPVIYTSRGIENMSAFVNFQSTNNIQFIKAIDSSVIKEIKQNEFTVMQDENVLEFYDDTCVPVIKLKFPSNEDAAQLSNLILEAPPKGFNHITSFLHSLSAFKNLSTFFPPDSVLFPAQLTNNLQKILNSNGCELLLYTFMLPADESKLNSSNALYMVKLVGDRFLPFIRAVIELNWIELTCGGLVLRQNTQLSYTTVAFLKATSGSYLSYIVDTFTAIFAPAAEQFKTTTFSLVEAKAFCDNIFQPIVNALFASIPKMNSSLRYILRTFFIRTSCHFVDEKAASIVIPNLLLLRFILPEFSSRNQKKIQMASLVGSSLLSLFYMTGWSPEKGGLQLSKLTEYMTNNYDGVRKFTRDLIQCEECEYTKEQVDYTGGMLVSDFVEYAAKHACLMNLSPANGLIHSHMDMVSMMQVLEEFTFDFSKLG